MHEEQKPDDLTAGEPRHGMSRRRMVGAGAAIATAAWAAPSILTISAASAASCFVGPPQLSLKGATYTDTPLSPSNDNRDDAQAFVWFEQGPIGFATPTPVDATGPGAWTIGNTAASSAIPAGTPLFSYYVHFRPASNTRIYNEGSITIPTGYSFAGLAFRGSGLPPVGPCGTGVGTLRKTDFLGRPGMTYAYCLKGGEGYENGPYAVISTPPPPAWATLIPPIDRDTVVVSPIPGGTLVQWYCFSAPPHSEDFRLFITPDDCGVPPTTPPTQPPF